MNLKIIDNFLDEKDYLALCSLKLKKIDHNSIQVYHNSVGKNNNVMQADCINSEKIIELNNRYHKKVINLLDELNPKKTKLYEYSEFHIVERGKDFIFPIHDDAPEKLLSGVIYLKPSINKGTIFYNNKKGEGSREIKWKTNKAVFFSREERNTWHSYEGDGKSNRLALVYNLMTTKIKEVYKIENKSFLIGQLRNKINPYLFRYFKTTIN